MQSFYKVCFMLTKTQFCADNDFCEKCKPWSRDAVFNTAVLRVIFVFQVGKLIAVCYDVPSVKGKLKIWCSEQCYNLQVECNRSGF